MGFLMYSFRKHSAGHSGGGQSQHPLPWLALGLVTLWPCHAALAGWSDPLESPSVLVPLAHQALMLDVARAGKQLVAVGEFGNILVSADDGVLWQQASVPVRVTLTSVSFVDAEYGWACGHDGVILATRDGGASWLRQFDGYRANDALVAAAEAALQSAESELSELEAAGDDIADAEALVESAAMALDDARYDQESGSTRPCLDIHFADRQRGIAVGAYGSVFMTSDGGEHWLEASARIENPERFHLNFIRALSPAEWWLGGESGLLFRSADAGERWETIESPYDGSLFDLNILGGERVLAGLRGHLFRLDDQQQWHEINHQGDQTLNASAVLGDGSLLLVGNAGALVKLNPDGSIAAETSLADSKSLAALLPLASGYLVAGEGGLWRLNDRGERQGVSVQSAQESRHAAQ